MDPRPRARRWFVDAFLALLLVPLVTLWALRLVGGTGVGFVADNEVGVFVDHLRAERSVVDTSGYRAHLPYLQELYRLDKSPMELVLEGNTAEVAITITVRDGVVCVG